MREGRSAKPLFNYNNNNNNFIHRWGQPPQNSLNLHGVNMCWQHHRDHEYVVLLSAVPVGKMSSQGLIQNIHVHNHIMNHFRKDYQHNVIIKMAVMMLTTKAKRVSLQERLVSRGLVCEIHGTQETQVLRIFFTFFISSAEFCQQLDNLDSQVNVYYSGIQLKVEEMSQIIRVDFSKD